MNDKQVARELLKVSRILTSGEREEAPKTSFEVFVDHLIVETTEDNYEDGEIGQSQINHSDKNFGVFKSVDEAVKSASNLTGIPVKNFYVFDAEDGRVEANGLVDNDNFYVGDDKRFLEKWKRGEERAWSARVSMYLHFAAVWVPTDSEIMKRSRLKRG